MVNLKKLKYSGKIISLFLFLLSLFMPRTFDERDTLRATTYSSLSIDKSLLRNGDIIFRRGISFVSNIVLETDVRSPYSHVGIVTLDSVTPFIIHAVPDESETEYDFIRKDSVNLFLRKDRASAFAIYRHRNSIVTDKAANIANNYYESRILFDGNFDLFDSKKYYCTELIWRAYQEAGLDITENVFDTLSIPLGTNPFLLPSTLLNSKYLTQVKISSIYQ